MGEDALDGAQRPRRAAGPPPSSPRPGEIQQLTPSIDALCTCPTSTSALDEEGAKRAFWSAFRVLGAVVRGPAALLSALAAAVRSRRCAPSAGLRGRLRAPAVASGAARVGGTGDLHVLVGSPARRAGAGRVRAVLLPGSRLRARAGCSPGWRRADSPRARRSPSSWRWRALGQALFAAPDAAGARLLAEPVAVLRAAVRRGLDIASCAPAARPPTLLAARSSRAGDFLIAERPGLGRAAAPAALGVADAVFLAFFAVLRAWRFGLRPRAVALARRLAGGGRRAGVAPGRRDPGGPRAGGGAARRNLDRLRPVFRRRAAGNVVGPWTSRSTRCETAGERCEECGARLTRRSCRLSWRTRGRRSAQSMPPRWSRWTRPRGGVTLRPSPARSCPACRRRRSARRRRRPRRGEGVGDGHPERARRRTAAGRGAPSRARSAPSPPAAGRAASRPAMRRALAHQRQQVELGLEPAADADDHDPPAGGQRARGSPARLGAPTSSSTTSNGPCSAKPSGSSTSAAPSVAHRVAQRPRCAPSR